MTALLYILVRAFIVAVVFHQYIWPNVGYCRPLLSDPVRKLIFYHIYFPLSSSISMAIEEQFILLSIGLATIGVRVGGRWHYAGPANWELDDYLMPTRYAATTSAVKIT